MKINLSGADRMPKREIETRVDFSGGLNIVANPDAMNGNELLQCVNARVEQFGGIMRRPGSKLLFATPLLSNVPGYVNEPFPIVGIKQWDVTSTQQQLVMISEGGNVFHSTAPYASVTEHIPANLLTGVPDFATFRANSAGAALHLFIAGFGLFEWDGTTLTRRVGALGSDPVATLVRSFGTRLFTNDAGNLKTLWWSAIGDGTNFTTGGGLSGPGSALVDVLTGNEIVGLETLGDSLFIGTNESISRFSGSGDNIQISQDTLGVSTEIGPSGAGTFWHAMLRAEQFIAIHSDRGVYIVTGGGVLSISDQITNPTQLALRITSNVKQASNNWVQTPLIGHNRRRNELWVAYVPVGGAGRNHCLVYNYRLQCWYGPFIYPFNISSFGVFEDTSGIESIIAGCTDAYIRLLDDPTAPLLDDNINDYESTVEFAPFGNLAGGPRTKKISEHVFLQAIGERTFDVTVEGDLGLTDNGVFVE